MVLKGKVGLLAKSKIQTISHRLFFIYEKKVLFIFILIKNASLQNKQTKKQHTTTYLNVRKLVEDDSNELLVRFQRKKKFYFPL